MRWLAWTMLMATAFGAGAAGLNSEFNPVRTPPQGSAANETGRVIVKLRTAGASGQRSKFQSAQDRISALMGRTGLTLRAMRPVTEFLHGVRVDPAVAGESIAATVERLRADPEVEYAEAEHWRYPHATTPNDPVFSQQWYMQASSATTPSAVDAVTAWDTTTGSTGLVIADLDTGVRFEHPDLQWAGSGGRLLPGYTFISDTFVANDGDARDADASDPGDWVVQADLSKPECTGGTAGNSSWHGTRVSGILGALSNNGVGIAGMTWSAWLLPVRVLGKCGGGDLDIVAGMLWAAGIPVSGAPNNLYPARIENMSLGGTGSCPQVYADTISQLSAQGVLVVVSAGNEGGPVDAPANCPGAAGVAGLRHAGTKVGFSSLGREIALSAPAGNCVNTTGGPCLYPITTSFNTGATTPGASGYTDQVNAPNLGTSFSAPIVSGIAGLMLAVNGTLTPAQLIARLKQGSLAFPQTSASVPAPPMCHVPASASDLQAQECICTLDGQTCGAGMANASGAVNAALRPFAVVPSSSTAAGANVALDASGSSAACHHTIASYQWVSSDPAAHPVSSPSGPTTTVTAPASGSAPFTVTLTVTDDAGKTDQATVTVSSSTATSSAPATAGTSACLSPITVPPPAVTVSVSPLTGSLQAGTGATETLTATVGYTLNTQVTWQVNTVAGGNATVGTITTGGVYTVPTTVPSPATVTVTAVSAADSTRSGSATITITAPSSGGGGGGGGGALDVLSLLALTLGGLTRAISRPYNSR